MARFLLVVVPVIILALAAACSSEQGSQEGETGTPGSGTGSSASEGQPDATTDLSELLAAGSESGAGADHATIADDTGALSMEVPSGWSDVLTGEDSEAGPSWSSLVGGGVGASITASTDLYAWHNASGVPGVYGVASRSLAQTYTDDQLIVSGPNDFSSSCEPGTRRDFDRPPYAGRMQVWKDCGGNDEANFLTLAAAPEGRECVVLLQIGMYDEADVEGGQHILDTFEADCRRITEAASAQYEPEDASETEFTARLGQEFTVGYGQEVSLEDEGLRVRFASVTSDSRCPTDPKVRCIWEGNAQIVIQLSKAGEDTASVELNTPNSRQETYPSESSYLDYTVELVALDPKPKTAGSVEAAEYVATLLITRR